MMEAIKFWLAKEIAHLISGLIFLAAFAAVFLGLYFFAVVEEWAKKRRRKRDA